jgi:excisionase family DNA binding protein
MDGNMNQLTTEEAALALGITPSRVRQMIRAGQLPATRFGKAHLIYEKDLALVQERPVGRPASKPPTANKAATQPANGSNKALTAAKAKKRGKR